MGTILIAEMEPNTKTRKTRKKGLGYEDNLHKLFANTIRQYEGWKQLDCAWWGYNAAGEKRSIITGSLLKAKGLKSGEADYQFLLKKQSGYSLSRYYADEYGRQRNVPTYSLHYIYLEFKKPKTSSSVAGTLSDKQEAFQAMVEDCDNADYYVVYSVQEALEILIKHGIIKS